MTADEGQRVILELRGLTKRFGELAAVADVSLIVNEGEILGLLGPNGCGKSTTLNLVMGFMRPTEGEVFIAGYSVSHAQRTALASVGGLVEGSAFYPYLSGRKNLQMLAKLHGLPLSRVEEVLELVDMHHPANRAFGGYSQGMRQRLGVAAALLHSPRLVVLDEPTSGLDPAGTREMRALLPRLASEGITVVLASHLLTEVEQVCTRVAIMQAGAIIATGSMSELLRGESRWRVRVGSDETERAAEVLRGLAAVTAVTVEHDDLMVLTPMDGATINQALIDAGIIASELDPVAHTLESVFLELTEGAHP